MTRLANPAAVARFADDNVAKFGGGGSIANPIAKINFSTTETGIKLYFDEATILALDDKGVSMLQEPIENEVDVVVPYSAIDESYIGRSTVYATDENGTNNYKLVMTAPEGVTLTDFEDGSYGLQIEVSGPVEISFVTNGIYS